MKKYIPIITLAAAAYGVIFWLRRKAAAGQNLRYEIADIAIDIPRIVESRFARIYFNTKLRLINDENASVNVKQINLNANVGNRTLGKILNNTPFSVPARSSNIVKIETSFSSGQIVLYIADIIRNGFQFNDPISLNGFILTDLGRINVDYTKNPQDGLLGDDHILNNIQGNC
jgi:LEA14-like dessication related protein